MSRKIKLKVHDGDTPGKVFELKLEYLKCPYCNKPLHCGAILKSDEYLINLYQCDNPECESTEFLVGCKEFWDILGQLIRTRKELDVAVDALKEINCCALDFTRARDALKEITALEQKDVK